MGIRSTVSVLLIFIALTAQAQTNFRTNQAGGGTWSDPSIWQVETPNGSNVWVAAGTSPTFGSNTISVRDADIVTISSDLTVDQLTVEANAGLIIDPGITLILNNGTGTDAAFTAGSAMVVYGRFTTNNLATFTGLDGSVDVFFEDGSFYRHLYQTSEGLIPVASWATNSTLEIYGYTASTSNLTFNGASSAQNWEQSFGNVIIDCPVAALRMVNFDSHLIDVQGNLTITRTSAAGTGRIQFTNATPVTMHVGDDFSITGNGRAYLNENTDLTMDIDSNFIFTSVNTNATRFVTAGTTTLNVGGDFTMNATGATLNLSQGSGVGTINMTGDFNLLAGTLSEASSGFGELRFVSPEPLGQNFNKVGTISNQINYYIAPGSTMNMGTSFAAGSGTFTADGNLRVGNITTGTINSGTTVGNIRVTGTRTFTAGITIEFNGAGAQLVGNAFPANVNIIVNNASGVTLSTGVPLTLSAGMNLDITAGSRLAIGANTLTLNGTISGTGTITGGATSNLTIGGTGSLGSLRFTTGSQSLNNFIINRTTGDATIATNLTTSGSLTQTNGDIQISASTLTINGAFTQTSGNLVVANDPTLVIGGAGALPTNVTFGGDLRLNTLTVNRVATFRTNSNLSIVSQLNLQNGTFDNQGAVGMLAGSVLTRSAGSLLNPLANFGGSQPFDIIYNNAGGVATGPELPNVLLDPQNSVLLVNLTKLGSGTLTLSSNVVINGIFTLSSGTFNAGSNTILMNGNVVSNATSVLTAATAQFGGSTTITGSVTPVFGNVNVLNGGSVTPNSTFQINGNLVNNGTLNSGSGTTIFGGTTVISGTSTSAFNNITITGTLTAPSNASILVAGNWVNNGTFNPGVNGTVEFSGTTNIVGTSTTNFNHIRVTGTLNSPTSLNVAGDFTDDGIFIAGSNTVVFNGTSIQNLAGTSTTTFNNINVTNTTGGPPGVRLATNKNIVGTLTLSPGATFDADGIANTAVFTLLSSNDNPAVDAAIAALTGGAQVQGSVTVQRYMSIEGGSNSPSFDNGRIYRYISSPVSGATVAQIQPEIPVTGTFTGTSSCSGCGTVQSMFLYNEAVITDTNGGGGNNSEDGYEDFPATANTEIMQTGRGYAVFVRGNLPPVVTNGFARWDVRNPVNTGTVNFTPLVSYTSSGNNASDGWNLVGNPYPSTIDWDAASGWTKTGLNNTIYMRDNGSNPVVYATYAGGVGTNGGSRYIPLGQAFFVKSDGGPINFQATESVKAPGNPAIFFRQATPSNILRIALRQGNVRDESVLRITPEASDTYDGSFDAYKLRNAAFNLSSLLEDGTQLAINSFAKIDCGKTIALDVSDVTPGTYELNFSELENFDAGIQIILRDAFKGTSIDVRSLPLYTFDITSDKASFGSGRFSVILTQVPMGAMTATTPAKACSGSDVKITLPSSEKGYSYALVVQGKTVAHADGTGKSLDIILSHQDLINGNNIVTIEAQSLACENIKLNSQATILVEEVQQATINVVDENTLVSNHVDGNAWYLDEVLLEGQTSQYLDVKKSGEYKLVVSTGSCSSTATREFIYTALEGGVTCIVYPNPLKRGEVLTIRSKDENLRQVSISNSLGAEIGQVYLVKEETSGSVSYVGTFDLKQHPSGLYFVKIKEGNKFRIVKIISL